MKRTKNFLLLSLFGLIAVFGMSVGAPAFAQTVTPLNCSVAMPSVVVNQTVVLTATGGNGAYLWSGQNLNVTNSAGSQFTVSYPSVGTYVITVTSAGMTSTCNVNVVAGTYTGTLACAPSFQNVTLGQVASVSATGGNGSYTWSSPDITISNPNGSGFSVNYASTGSKIMSVSSAGSVATCTINVLSSGVVPTPVPPGLPNTGGGYRR